MDILKTITTFDDAINTVDGMIRGLEYLKAYAPKGAKIEVRNWNSGEVKAMQLVERTAYGRGKVFEIMVNPTIEETPLGQRGWERAMGMRGKAGSPADQERVTDPQVFARMDEAVAAALPTDYIMAFESIATGTLMYASVSDPTKMGSRKKLVQMRGPVAKGGK